MSLAVPRWSLALPVAGYAVGAALQAGLSVGSGVGDPPPVLALIAVLLGVPVLLGALIGFRVPGNPVGPALAWVGAAPALTFAVENWGESRSWPAAALIGWIGGGAWVWNLAGFAALCLVFPDGLLPGRRWRSVAWAVLAAGCLVNALAAYAASEPAGSAVEIVVYVVFGFGSCLAALVACVTALRVRYRRGDEKTRQQLRWLTLGAGSVPVLLVAGWVLESAGVSPSLAYPWFLLAMLLLVPATVVVAVLRHDLFDVDRLLGATLSWLLTTVGSAGLFAAAVLLSGLAGADSRLGVTGSAFVTALVLLPLHRRLNDLVGRVLDRDRYVVAARVREFVRQVRDGTAEPEDTEEVLRQVLGDPGLRLLLRRPGGAGYVRPSGEVADPGGEVIPLRSGPVDVGVLELGAPTARRRRRAREAIVEARLPIEVSRLRLELRDALREVRSSRERLLTATAAERRRMERDLHDGAQQRIVAVGMRLRSLQRTVEPESATSQELDLAVESLEATIAELRRLAHGLRPGRLDDGLPAALVALVADSPIAVGCAVADVEVSDVVATTVYFVVAEAYANALKYASARTVSIAVEPRDDALVVEVRDDGVGGAHPRLTAVTDRVAAIGGRLHVDSPPGVGTTVTVEIPDAHRRRG